MNKSYGWATGVYVKGKLLNAGYFTTRKEARTTLKVLMEAIKEKLESGVASVKTFRVIHEEVKI